MTCPVPLWTKDCQLTKNVFCKHIKRWSTTAVWKHKLLFHNTVTNTFPKNKKLVSPSVSKTVLKWSAKTPAVKTVTTLFHHAVTTTNSKQQTCLHKKCCQQHSNISKNRGLACSKQQTTFTKNQRPQKQKPKTTNLLFLQQVHEINHNTLGWDSL